MRSSRGPTSCLLALLACIGCAKGSSVEDGFTSFNLSSVGSVSATNSSETDDATGTSDDPTAGEVGGESCGDGVSEAPEQCDGPDLAGQSCVTQGFSGGQLTCSAKCVLDTSLCSDACGDGAIDPGENCDKSALGDADCVSEGFAGGQLSCASDCTFDTAACTDTACGDGTVQDGEECDCGVMGSPCSPDQLGSMSCTGLPAPGGGNYSGGTLACTPSTCTLDEGGCTICGDNIVDAGESCDGNQLGGQTCQTQGFSSGTLACSMACTFDSSGCSNIVCGNGSCEPGEDSCNCEGDCPDDPNSCGIPCECGFSGGNCFCDDACVNYDDCCPNGPC